MAWPYKKLDDVAEMVCSAIGEELNIAMFITGKEYEPDDGMAYEISSVGDSLQTIKFKLSISDTDINKAFYEGRPE